MHGWSPRAEQTLSEDKRTAAAHQRIPKKTLSICGPNLYPPTARQQAVPLAPRPPLVHSAGMVAGLIRSSAKLHLAQHRGGDARMHARMHTHARAHTR